MDFNEQIDDLQGRVEQLRSTVSAAADENHEQLTQRIDAAQAETTQALSEAKQDASAAADKAKSQWEQMLADAQARVAELKAKAERRADQIDADLAASEADCGRRRRLLRDRLRRLGSRERSPGDPRRDRRAGVRGRAGGCRRLILHGTTGTARPGGAPFRSFSPH